MFVVVFSDVCNADLSSYSAQCVASVLKKFLRELPDPVIPVQFYDRFIEASSEYPKQALRYCNNASLILQVVSSVFLTNVQI